jgi:hypothetical protein
LGLYKALLLLLLLAAWTFEHSCQQHAELLLLSIMCTGGALMLYDILPCLKSVSFTID